MSRSTDSASRRTLPAWCCSNPRQTIDNAVILKRNDEGHEAQIGLIGESFVPAAGLKKLRLTSYDPGYLNTAVCTSAITYLDGEKGVLRYRGYPIEALAELASFEEVSYLLLHGELPSKMELQRWTSRIAAVPPLHKEIQSVIESFRPDAPSMSVLISALAALGALYPDANPAIHQQGVTLYRSKPLREEQIVRLLAAVPQIAAQTLRCRNGQAHPAVSSSIEASSLSYVERFLYAAGLGSVQSGGWEGERKLDPRVVRALDVILILHADHELNCSTAAVRHLTSSGVDIFSAVAGATAALYGPLHGGATEAVLKMLEGIGRADRIPTFLRAVKEKKVKLMGFGHRVYKTYDPRAKIVRQVAYDVFEVYGADPLIGLAVTLEQAARDDDYFVSRSLYPNIDFYTGLLYRAIGFPTDFFPILFTMGRVAGWLAHWNELWEGPAEERRIVRPRQVYCGHGLREYSESRQIRARL